MRIRAVPRGGRALALALSIAVVAATPAPAAAHAAAGRVAEASASCDEHNGWAFARIVVPAIPGVDSDMYEKFADLDADGDDDLLLIDRIGGIRAWRNDGATGPEGFGWSYLGRIAAGTGYSTLQIKFADIDGDGRDDYVVVKPGGSIDAWINKGGDVTSAGGVTSGWEFAGEIFRGTGARYYDVSFADLDGDGDDDYLVAGELEGDPVRGWRNDGRAGWTDWGEVHQTALTGYWDYYEDMNCDGRDDLITRYTDESLRILINRGRQDGTFSWVWEAKASPPRGEVWADVWFADLNGDGRADYLTGLDDGSIRAWMNNGGDAL